MGSKRSVPSISSVKTKTYLPDGRSEMSRAHYSIVRKPMARFLGRLSSYSRSGGEIPSPIYQKSFVCPPFIDADVGALLNGVFRPT